MQGVKLKDVLSMRLFRVSVLRFTRSGLALLFVTLAVYVILTYKVSTDVTKRTVLGQGSQWKMGTADMTGNLRQTVFTASQGKDSKVQGDTKEDVELNLTNAKNALSSTATENGGLKGGNQRDTTPTGDNPAAQETKKGTEVQSLNLDQLRPENLLLAGVPRKRRVHLSIGLVTVSREKGDYFFDTLNSLLSRSTAEEQRELTIVVMLADRNATHNARVLQTIQTRHVRELSEGLLLVIRGANTDFLFKDAQVKRTYNDSLDRVLWRSKQNLDYAAIIEFATNLSTYYLHIEDDVIAAQMYIRHLSEFIRTNAGRPWAMLELSPHGFIGKLFKNKDLPKLVMILRAFYLEQPCDFLIKPYFINIMTQQKPIVRRSPLFFHKGKFSSLKNVTRKVDKYSGGPVRKNVEWAVKKVMKATRNHQNPPATVYANMTVFNNNHISGPYDPTKPGFFWASDVKEGQYVSIVFHTPQKLERLVVETGFSDKERKDVLHEGSIEIGRDVPEILGTKRCPNTQKIGDFKGGNFDAPVTSKDDVRCINIVVTKSQKDWLIIREILVFVPKVTALQPKS